MRLYGFSEIDLLLTCLVLKKAHSILGSEFLQPTTKYYKT